MRNRILVIACFLIAAINAPVPLCDGDFEQKKPPPGQTRLAFLSDPSCWYSPHMSYLEAFSFSSTSTFVDLYTVKKQYYCQIVTLVPGQKYVMGFDITVNWRINHVNVETYINSVLKSEFFIKESSQTLTGSFRFVADTASNQFCFTENHYLNDTIDPSFAYGAGLDNVTLDEVILSQISFQTVSSIASFDLISNFTFDEQIVQEMENRYTLQASDQTLVTGVEYMRGDNGFLVIKAQVPESVYQATIHFGVKEEYIQNKLYQYEIVINGVYRNPEANSQNQQNVQIVENVESQESQETQQNQEEQEIEQQAQNQKQQINPAIQIFGEFIKYFKDFMGLIVCSYFILSLIGFWNVSLLYIFLQIDIVPHSVRLIYERMMQILFQRVNIVKFLAFIFQFSEDNIHFKVQENVRELIPFTKYNLTWFGTYDMSSKIFTNNFQFIIELCLVIIKILAVKLLVRIIQYNAGKKFKVSFNYNLIFIAQFIKCIPFIAISAQACMVTSMESFKEYYTKMFQIIILFLTILSFSLLVIIIHRKKKKVKKTKRKQKGKKKQLVLQSKNQVKKKLTQIENNNKQNPVFQNDNQEKRKTKKGQQPIQQNNNEIAIKDATKKYQISLENNNNKNRQKQFAFIKNQPINKIKPKRRFYDYEDGAIANLHILGIPLVLLLFPKQFFFSAILLFIVARIAYYLRVKTIRRLERVYLIVINIVWLFHHCGFMGFYILSRLNAQDYFSGDVPFVEEIGLLVIITVLTGGSIEIIKIGIQLIIFGKNLLNLSYEKKKLDIAPVQPPKRSKGKKEGIEKKQDQNVQKVSDLSKKPQVSDSMKIFRQSPYSGSIPIQDSQLQQQPNIKETSSKNCSNKKSFAKITENISLYDSKRPILKSYTIIQKSTLKDSNKSKKLPVLKPIKPEKH